jgi:hypothetical protein
MKEKQFVVFDFQNKFNDNFLFEFLFTVVCLLLFVYYFHLLTDFIEKLKIK